MLNQKLQDLIEDLVQKNTWLHAVLSSPRNKQIPQKVVIRPLVIKKKITYQLTHQYKQKVIHENVSQKEFPEVVMALLSQYKQALICSSIEDYHILLNKRGEATLFTKPASKSPLSTYSHNRQKNYLLKESTPIPFLVELGVMSATGKIHADKRDKFRQINRFLEMINDILPDLIQDNSKDKTLQIVDFGCGKAYLTFALYHFLHVEKKYKVEIDRPRSKRGCCGFLSRSGP